MNRGSTVNATDSSVNTREGESQKRESSVSDEESSAPNRQWEGHHGRERAQTSSHPQDKGVSGGVRARLLCFCEGSCFRRDPGGEERTHSTDEEPVEEVPVLGGVHRHVARVLLLQQLGDTWAAGMVNPRGGTQKKGGGQSVKGIEVFVCCLLFASRNKKKTKSWNLHTQKCGFGWRKMNMLILLINRIIIHPDRRAPMV